MSGRKMRYDREHRPHPTSATVVGVDSKPPANMPRNILVDPLKGPPMQPVKDADARPGLREEED